jgi:putative ABC transport system substrate-binding protein
VLTNVANPLHVPQLREIEDAAAKGAIAVTRLEVGKPDELDTSFRALLQNRVDALLVPPDTLFNTLRRRVVGLAAAFRVPAMYGFRENVEDGGLMSYGVNIGESYRRAATYVDRILRGTPPADLPVEQPTRIELVINLKTARALGLTVPPTLLARADEVIE